MQRKHNFSAGPAALPDAVLERAQQDLLDWQGRGLSIMEMSHRSDEFVGVATQAEQTLRELLGISDDYAVLFLQGGATSQFAMVPMNLLAIASSAKQNTENPKAAYVDTGIWSAKAIKEAKRYCEVSLAGSTKDQSYTHAPDQAQLLIPADAAYLHYTTNETIGGVQFDYVPEAGVPLVADMSSDILSRPIDVDQYGLIYAGAQKNIGPAGLTLVIVRRELLKGTIAGTPSMYDYRLHDKAESMNNTPPTFAWYLAGLVFEWLKEQGGLSAIAEVNARKANRLYSAIDSSDFYSNPIRPSNRSQMNVPFTLAKPELESEFLREAEERDLLNLKGHRSVGGMRASIYNAVSETSVECLIDFMTDFEARRG